MGSNMVKVSIGILKAIRRLDIGKMARMWAGVINIKIRRIMLFRKYMVLIDYKIMR